MQTETQFQTLADALGTLLKAKGWTGLELAEKSGLHKNTISAFMRSKLWPTRSKTVAKVANALGVEPAWLQAVIDREFKAAGVGK